MKTHKDLVVWQKAMDLVERVYAATQHFPISEQYGLTNQMRRAAVSIPSNIAEGAARNSDKEFIQFLHISLGSIAELETQLLIAERLMFLKQNLLEELNSIKMMLLGLIKSVRAKKAVRCEK